MPVLILCMLLGALYGSAQTWKDFDFKVGDIVFQDLDCGALCDAIETVTPASNGKHFSHAGIVFKAGQNTFVIEAIGKEVHSTPIEKFMKRQTDSTGNPKVVVGRLKKQYRHLNTEAVNFAIGQSGKPYDNVFLYGNDKYYCTELIYDAYKAANKETSFFSLFPMTYKNPATGQTFRAWVDYYAELRVEIPEGQPGCNPGSVATDPKIEIIRAFY